LISGTIPLMMRIGTMPEQGDVVISRPILYLLNNIHWDVVNSSSSADGVCRIE
jgi:hypothetical protein